MPEGFDPGLSGRVIDSVLADYYQSLSDLIIKKHILPHLVGPPRGPPLGGGLEGHFGLSLGARPEGWV